MRTGLSCLLLLLLLAPVHADGILLADGRRLSGRVTENKEKDGYEIVVDGQTLAFAKKDVQQWIRNPREVLGDADRLFENAKRIYQEAVAIADDKAAEPKYREALPMVQKARDAYAEARDYFPDGYPELDTQLVNIMKLMRLVRERIGSQFAGGGSTAPVKAKKSPPPVRATAKAVPAPAPVVAPPKPQAPPEADPAAAAPAEDPSPVDAPVTIPAPGEEPEPVVLSEAIAVLVDPARRADPALRSRAAETFRKGCDARYPLADIARAGQLLLSRPDKDWGLLSDVVTFKGPAGEQTWRGRLEKQSDKLSLLELPDGREVRLRQDAEGTHVTVPGAAELKRVSVKITADQPTEAFDALQSVFTGLGAEKLESLSDSELAEGVKFLALKVKELKTKNQPVEALSLFVAGAASALIAKHEGKSVPDLEAAFKDLGYIKSEFGSVWGRKEGLALDDYRKWLASGDFGLAIVQFRNDYKGLNDLGVHYALGMLTLFKSLGENRNYQHAYLYLERTARELPDTAREHFTALAKSIRAAAPCAVCAGTHKVNCGTCKGTKLMNWICGGCGGSGKINQLRGGIVACVHCKGMGRGFNEPCAKCNQTGKKDCKASGCSREVPKPTFESFAEAFQCALCQGRGSLMRHVALPCSECTGIGLIIQPRTAPTRLLR